jgi:outer membrane protein, multidrug efflux system
MSATAGLASIIIAAFDEVEVALTNEQLLAERFPYMENAVLTHTEAVRVAELRYRAGNMDLLSVLQLQEGQIQSQADLIKLRNTQLANRINLHLALGGSFDSSTATSTAPATTAKKH